MRHAMYDEEAPWNNFYCSVHPLDALAKTAEKTVKGAESGLVEPSDPSRAHTFRHRQESETQALIQAVYKICYKDGVGCPAESSAFLHGKGLKEMPVVQFLGSRFNILFVNAAGVFYVSDLLLFFLGKSVGNTK